MFFYYVCSNCGIMLPEREVDNIYGEYVCPKCEHVMDGVDHNNTTSGVYNEKGK